MLTAEVSDGAAESVLRASTIGAVREPSCEVHAILVSNVSIAKA